MAKQGAPLKDGKKEFCKGLDICILTEKEIVHGDILARVRPIGGFRMIDGNESDDKFVAVLNNNAVYSVYKDISDCPPMVIDRLKHYFLTFLPIRICLEIPVMLRSQMYLGKKRHMKS